jgi:hypothetical protein
MIPDRRNPATLSCRACIAARIAPIGVLSSNDANGSAMSRAVKPFKNKCSEFSGLLKSAS